MKTTKKAIFTTCHALTKKIVSGTKYNYHCTFTACLQLFYSDYNSFCIACTANNIDVLPVAGKFDGLYDNINNMDQDFSCEKQVKQAINFAVNFALKKKSANMSKQDLYKYSNGYSIPCDTPAFEICQNLHKNNFDDLKQDTIIYLLRRANNADFIALPDVVKLMRAGDSVVTSYYNKIIRECKNNAFSMDDDNIQEVASYDKNKLNYMDIVNKLINNTPVKHRELAKDIIKIRYLDGRKEKTIAETACRLNVSVRTVKTVLKEMTDGLDYADFVQV